MKNGAVKIEFAAGEIRKVSTSPGLDAFYRRMFEDAKERATKSSDDVTNGIQVIVFGTFLVEAVCNDSYKAFLSGAIPNSQLGDAIWSATKRLAILEKVSVAVAVSSHDKAEIDVQMGKLKLLFDLRNRLAHFKDSDTVWEAPVDFISKPENWSNAPDPELMGHLTGKKLSDYVADIDHLLRWFDKIFRLKRKTVKIVS